MGPLSEIGTLLGQATLVLLLSCVTGPLAMWLGDQIILRVYWDAPATGGMVLFLYALCLGFVLYALLTAGGMYLFQRGWSAARPVTRAD